MFSYRHAFHAGNHADVLKHCTLVQILGYYRKKDKPFWYFDTHAGAGIYALDGEWALKTGEYAGGIERLWNAAGLPPILADYVEQVRRFNPDGHLARYPGSPWLALQMLGERDRLRLFEWHGSEVEVLHDNLRGRSRADARRTMIYAADGFNGLKALLPPPTRRGVILIDPSYENKQDYQYVVRTVQEGLDRFASGCYAVWYPLIQRRDAGRLAEKLARLPLKSWVHASLDLDPANTGLGLHGSGMFVINPPYTLKEELAAGLPWLAEHLGHGRARHLLQSAG